MTVREGPSQRCTAYLPLNRCTPPGLFLPSCSQARAASGSRGANSGSRARGSATESAPEPTRSEPVMVWLGPSKRSTRCFEAYSPGLEKRGSATTRAPAAGRVPEVTGQHRATVHRQLAQTCAKLAHHIEQGLSEALGPAAARARERAPAGAQPAAAVLGADAALMLRFFATPRALRGLGRR